MNTIAVLFKEYKPFYFFGLISLLLLLLSLIFGVPVIIEFFETGLVPRFPTLIVSGVFLTLAFLFWITGIILDVIVKKNRQSYELYLNLLRKK